MRELAAIYEERGVEPGLARLVAGARGACPVMYTGLEYSNSGIQAIRAVHTLFALAGFLDREYGTPTKSEQLFVTGGNSQALDFVCGRFARPQNDLLDLLEVQQPVGQLQIVGGQRLQDPPQQNSARCADTEAAEQSDQINGG